MFKEFLGWSYFVLIFILNGLSSLQVISKNNYKISSLLFCLQKFIKLYFESS